MGSTLPLIGFICLYLTKAGQWTIAEGAQVIGDIIQDAWTGRTGDQPFRNMFNKVTITLGVPNLSPDLKTRSTNHHQLRLPCQDWLRDNPRNPTWKNPDQYIAVCRYVGHKIDLDDLR
jgi:hypothetical protein